MREPIEKSLRNKVKLGRWEDRTYYRLKETTEKSHRQIAKIIRDYQQVLQRSMLSEIFSRPLKREQSEGIVPEQSQIARFMTAMNLRCEKSRQTPTEYFENSGTKIYQNFPKELVDLFDLNKEGKGPKLSRIDRIISRARKIVWTEILPNLFSDPVKRNIENIVKMGVF